MRPTYLLTISSAFLCLCVGGAGRLANAQPPQMELTIGGRVEVGLPVFWSKRDVLLLRRDGSILQFKTPQIEKKEVTKVPFQALETMKVVGGLQLEFPVGMEVETQGRYIVAAPIGKAGYWLERFENLANSFQHYFSTRGMRLRQLEFPLVAIVLPNQASFLAYARRDGAQVDGSVLGYYSVYTNRMILFDLQGSQSDAFSNDSTIAHEATHQLAYNMGVHQRLSDVPLWAVEGLASVFEAPSIGNSKGNGQNNQRIQPARLKTWKQMRQNEKESLAFVARLLEDDRLFESSADPAYASAWAISFYLAEKEPTRYVRYLESIGDLAPHVAYPKPDRVRDFQQGISSDLLMLCRSVDRLLEAYD